MNKQQLLGQRQYFDMVHGVTLRAIAAFGDKDLDFRPKEGMRSPRELVLHIYGFEKVIALGVPQARLTKELENTDIPETEEGKAELAKLKTADDLQKFARECHKAAGDALAAMSDEDLARMVESSFGTFPAWQFFTFAYDEHWHHRGQLYTYLRLLGKEPPMLYSY
jgi:uncharacterized damage-inducible protein DinB